ncbi:amino acid ABC transporter permease [Pseudomonas sp. B22129]|uniref:amino acid ABC transporter permease n=1 Tax=Pseudomonas sp. B22129 TaxID=3235111 RepID=UPI003782ECF1
MLDRQFFDVIGLLLHGVVATFYITLSCFITAFALGLGVAVLRRLSGHRTGAVLSALVFIVRSIPVLVLLFLVYFGLPSLGIRPSPMIAMNLSLGVIGGAYISEVFRGALGSVEHQERVAAQSMGFSDLQVVLYIELPQMLRFSLPGVMNELTAILKNTPFAYTVGFTEILGQAKALTASTSLGVNIYLVAGLMYFCIYKIFAVAMLMVRRRFADQ